MPSWAVLGCLGAILGRSWAVFGLAWAVSAPSWGRLGAILGLLGTIWGHLEPSWGRLEAMLSCLVAETASRSPHVAKTLFFAKNFNDFMTRGSAGTYQDSGSWGLRTF